MPGEIRLQLDAKQRSRWKNWIEFHDWNLRYLEEFEKKRDEVKKELDDVRRKAEDIHNSNSERAEKDADAVQQDLDYAERKVKRHRILLQ